jgi:hypothetical protein
MNVENIPRHILDDLQERCDEEEIKGCSAEYLFNEYCEWHGLRGWGEQLLHVLESLKKAEEQS